MKICLISRVLPEHGRGGMQDHVSDLARGLAQKGHEVHVISTRHPKGKLVSIKQGVRLYFLPRTTAATYNNAWKRESFAFLKELHQTIHFDVIHSQGHAALWLPELRQKHNFALPVVITLHGTYWDEMQTGFNIFRHPQNFSSLFWGSAQAIWGFYNHAMIRSAVRKFDGVIATSYEQKDIIQNYYQVSENQIFLVLNGIDTNLFSPKQVDIDRLDEYYPDKQNFILLSVARLGEEKGVQFAIEAMSQIIQVIPQARLVIIGNGRYKTSLEKLAIRQRVNAYVRFTGLIDLLQLPRFYQSSHIFLNPTLRQDGYDLTVLQAMACQKPVIISDISSYRTVVQDRWDGFLIGMGDAAALAKRIIELYNHPQLRADLGNNARKKVVRLFSLEKMIESTIKAYDALLERN